MIISLPVQTAVRDFRAEAALAVLVASQLSASGLYLPPVLAKMPPTSSPPHTIISLPAHTAVCLIRPSGALIIVVAVQLSAVGLSLRPVFVKRVSLKMTVSLRF